MTDIPAWVLGLAVPVGAFLGVLITVAVTRKNANDATRTATHQARLETLRWAAQLAVSQDEAEARLGVMELEKLGQDPELLPQEQELIDAALEAAQYADKQRLEQAPPDAEVVYLDEGETIGSPDQQREIR